MEELIKELPNKINISSGEYKLDMLIKILNTIKTCIKNSESSNLVNDFKDIKQEFLELVSYLQFEFLIKSLSNENIQVRKISLEIILLLLYKNKNIQYLFLKEMNIIPIGDVISLNWFPPKLLKVLDNKISIKHLSDIQSKASCLNPFYFQCDYFNMWPPNYKQYNINNLPDPLCYLISFYYTDENVFYEEGLFKSNKEVNNYLIILRI